ncbi:MAG: GNAT family N-acetyltransferase, partial [Actinomycetota bacterium]|nr:GNAT family N-acetyltransferase [Actinomycetota bacterium]
ARLGRLVVRRDVRRRGIATALLAEAEREARSAGAHLIVLNAQTAAQPLYEQAGYVERGERFVQEGIEHVTMRKELVRA